MEDVQEVSKACKSLDTTLHGQSLDHSNGIQNLIRQEDLFRTVPPTEALQC